MESLKIFSDLRPINLCNFNFKILSKLLTTHLSPVLPTIIVEGQSGFTKSRSITNNIMLAQEII